MVRRLVIGYGAVGRAVIDVVADWRGDLFVVERDERRVNALRDENIAAECIDPTETDAIAAIDYAPDIIFVASDDSELNRSMAEAAREAYPDAYLIAYAGLDHDPDTSRALADVANRVIEYGTATAGELLRRIDAEEAQRLGRLRRIIRGIDGTLGVFTHDNPDPDAIASATALCEIANTVDVDAQTCYFGEISHQENRAFVNLLDLDLRRFAPEEFDPEEFDAIALVDHARAGVNDQLPEDTPVEIVIDHHPPTVPVYAPFVDLRSNVGATSTLLAEYLQGLDTDPDESVATGLLYGIQVDTRNFSREVSKMDFEAAAFLLPYADTDVLTRIENPSMSANTLETIASAIANRQLEGSVLASCVGTLNDRDALAQAADYLLNMDGVTTTMIYGFRDDTVYVSARDRGTDIDLGEVLRHAFDQIGSAGGHADMAGAQLSLGILAELDDDVEESLTEVVTEVIGNRFFEAMRDVTETGTIPYSPVDTELE